MGKMKMIVMSMWVLFVCVSVASAGLIPEGLSVTTKSSYSVPEEGADNGLGVGAEAMFAVHEHASLGVDAEWKRFEVDRLGRLDFFPLMLVGQARPGERTDRVQPYGLAGVGVAFSDFNESDFVSLAGLTVDVDPAFVWKAGLGVDLFPKADSRDQSLKLELVYLGGEIDGDVNGIKIKDVDANQVTGSVGWTWHF